MEVTLYSLNYSSNISEAVRSVQFWLSISKYPILDKKKYNVVIACGDYKHGIVKLCEKANISLFLGVFTAGTQHTNYFLYLFG